MEELFNKEVKVNQTQFEELMKILEERTDFTWPSFLGVPTNFKPIKLIDLGYIYIQFWSDYRLTYYDVEGKQEFTLISFEEVKQILTKGINQ